MGGRRLILIPQRPGSIESEGKRVGKPRSRFRSAPKLRESQFEIGVDNRPPMRPPCFHAVWQTGELGLALGTAWRLARSVTVNFELGYAFGDGASYSLNGYGNNLSFSNGGRYVIGWRLLFGT